MSDDIITPSSSGVHEIEMTRTQTDSRERVTLIICITVVISLICVALIIAIARAETKDKDYASLLLPVVSGSVFGLLGFRAGAAKRSSDK